MNNITNNKNLLIGITSYHIDKHEKLVRLTQKCLNSVGFNIHQNSNIKAILLDNNSDLSKINIPQCVNIIKTQYNNLSKSWNEICKLGFYTLNYDYCLIMNNDIMLLPDSINTLMNFAYNKGKQYGIIYGSELENNNLNKGYMFSCFLIKKRFYEGIGEFDENLPFCMNDWDYNERCILVNSPPFYYRDFKVIHDRCSSKNLFKNVDEYKKTDEKSLLYYREKWKGKNVKLP